MTAQIWGMVMSNQGDTSASGLDSVTDAMDVYLMDGVHAVEGWLGSSTLDKSPELAAAYALGCAVMHAADIVAKALDRQSAAQSRCSRRRNS